MAECKYKYLDYGGDGVSRTPGEETAVACGVAACNYIITLVGLGEDRTPVFKESTGECAAGLG